MSDPFSAAYGILCLATAIIALLTLANWRRLGGAEQLVIGSLFYYYALYGAWKILAVKRGVAESESLHHLEVSLFKISIDQDYIQSLIIYGLFSVVFLASIWLFAGRGAKRFDGCAKRIVVAPDLAMVTVVSLAAFVLSVLAIWPQVAAARAEGVPIYLYTRTQVGSWFTVHQLLNRVGLICLSLGWPLFILGQLRGSSRRAVGAIILSVMTMVWAGYLGLLGNRNELLIAIVASVYLYTLLGGWPRWHLLIAFGVLSYVAFRTIQTLRAVSPDEMSTALLRSLADPVFWNPNALIGGSESLAAHISLYGIISHSIPWTWGSSVLYFVQSLVPGLQRTQDTYTIYANAVGAPASQGFNIHFAAGSYLNCGPVGVVLGAVVLATLYTCIRWVTMRWRGSSQVGIGVLSGYAFFCALLPIAMRGGPEGLKALLFEGFIIPFAVALFCSARAFVPARRTN